MILLVLLVVVVISVKHGLVKWSKRGYLMNMKREDLQDLMNTNQELKYLGDEVMEGK